MRRPLLLDSHLLLLLVVGLASPAYIAKHKRLPAYTIADFHLLQSIVVQASAILVTPNTLTEASNLLAYVGEPIRSEIFIVFRKLIGEAEERYAESARVSQRSEFIRLGLTDTAIIGLANDEVEILTADVALYVAASTAGRKVRNFHHLREVSGIA